MRAYITLFLSTCWLTLAIASEPVFQKVDVREGDGIYTLLKRYDLVDQASIEKFCELNRLDLSSSLVIGRDYVLPVFVYTYDGKSIRSTIGIDNWDLAVRIAKYNRELQSRGLRDASYEESSVLWVPYRELVEGGAPKITAASNTGATTPGKKVLIEPLFGEEYSRVEVLSQKLAGKVFYIVSGHGGPDPGAMSVASGHTLCEDEYAYDVSLRLARSLMEHGAIVEMVVQDPDDGIRDAHYLKCDRDEYTSDKRAMPLNQLQRLKQRVELVNSIHKQYLKKGISDQTVICIHVDSQTPRSRQDVYFYYYEGSKTGKRLAESLQDTFRAKYQEKRSGRGYSGSVSSRSLYELRHTDPAAVYIELANIQNSADLKRILPQSNRQAVANWICDGRLSCKS
jgi:N-acetylmuramoyl-L-alanine amidase